jgi:hypothetical protein
VSPLFAWARRWSVPYDALADLRHMLGIDLPALPQAQAGLSEAAVQSRIRLTAPKRNRVLWRNNRGALLNEAGVPIRFGLANETPAMGKSLRSSDLIGWERVLITGGMVGTYVAVFVADEVKEGCWTYTGNEHERAQLAFLNLVLRDGGYARFVNSEDA